MARKRKYGVSFSWKRASGLSGLKQRISRKTGIPLCHPALARKIGRMTGCCIPLALFIGSLAAFAALAFA